MSETPTEQTATPSKYEAFSFGDPMPVLSQREVFDYMEECTTVNIMNRH